MKISRSVGIHDGTFHADEVTACGLLINFGLVDREKVIRSRDPEKLAECEYVCDVGGVYDPDKKCFDHHQVSYTGDLSSAGMVLRYLFDQNIITQEEYHFFNHSLILGVDAHDNGRSPQIVGFCTFSHVIANFNPVIYDAPEEALEKSFEEALGFAIGHLRRFHERFLYNRKCRDVVKEVMESHEICLMFEHATPWLESFFALGGKHHPALFVIMPAGEYWKLRCIPPDYEHRMQVRLPLPEEWAGLLGDDLKRVSGIEGAIFCHKGRFTSVWETREDALKALQIVLSEGK